MSHAFSGERLRAIRRAAQKSRDSIAVAACLSGSAVTRYEQGKAIPSVNAAARLAAALEVPITDFLDGTAEAHDIRELPDWAQALIRDLRGDMTGAHAAARAVSAA